MESRGGKVEPKVEKWGKKWKSGTKSGKVEPKLEKWNQNWKGGTKSGKVEPKTGKLDLFSVINFVDPDGKRSHSSITNPSIDIALPCIYASISSDNLACIICLAHASCSAAFVANRSCLQ